MLFQHYPEPLVFQMFGDPHQGMGIVRFEMVGPDPEPGQFELDGQIGAAFRPDKGNDAAAVQIFQTEDPENPQTEQGETEDGHQDHQIVGGQQPLPDGQIFPAHKVHFLLCTAGTPFFCTVSYYTIHGRKCRVQSEEHRR